jgi:hypothetical protein
MEFGVEENIETTHPHFEKLGEKEVTALMQQHKQRDGQQKLQQSD